MQSVCQSIIWFSIVQDKKKEEKNNKSNEDKKEENDILTHYDILGVPYDATQEQIKKAYREQIRFFHPDVFDGSEDVARIKTQQLNESYEFLSNPLRRAEYDRFLKQQGKYKETKKQEDAKTSKTQSTQKDKAEEKKAQDASPDEDQSKKWSTPEESVDEDRVKEEAEKLQKKRKEKSEAFWRTAKIAIVLAVILFAWKCWTAEYDKNTAAKIQAAWDEGRTQGYDEGYDDGYEAGNEDGFAAGAEAGIDAATYKAKLDYTGVYLDPNMGLYHKEGCMLIPEDADFDILEVAQENNLEPCYFCTAEADYTAGYEAGYVAGWVDRASAILSEGTG